MHSPCYTLQQTSKDFERKFDIAMSVILPFVQAFDAFYHMNLLINVSNRDKSPFWSLEKNFNPIKTLFLLCQIHDDVHQEILLDLVYSIAAKRIGDKDFHDRATEIIHAFHEKLVSFN